MKLFRVNTKDDITNSLAAFMPGGRIFAAKNQDGTNLRKLLTGLSVELFRIDEQMNLISQDFDINVTTQFIEQWESAVGIPDNCFNGTGTLEERRLAILAKFAQMNLTTDQDFIDLAALFGINITIITGASLSVFPLIFPHVLFGSEKEARFTMFVQFEIPLDTFPYIFPFTFGDATRGLIECLFSKSKPANVQIIYQ
jgi:uncharacterized protein YmfQ (DUF2313 family)